MRTELYINGTRADLDSKTKITVEYRSGILDDISKYTASYSFSFSLPKTTANRRLFDGAEIVGHESNMARKYSRALLLCDGVDILGGTGTAALLSMTSTTYEVALLFDFAPGLQKWLDKGESIKDIEIISIPWKRECVAWEDLENDDSDIFQPRYRFAGFQYIEHDDMYLHPAVRERYILKQILQNIGTTAELPEKIITEGGIHDEDTEQYIRLAVPLPTRERLSSEEDASFYAQNAPKVGGSNKAIPFFETTSTSTKGLYDYDLRRFNVVHGVTAWSIKGIIEVGSSGTKAAIHLQASMDGITYKTVSSYETEAYPDQDRNYYINVDDAPNLDGYKYFNLVRGDDTNTAQVNLLTIQATQTLVEIGDSFGSNNLPDIKQSDFLIAAMAFRNAVAKITKNAQGEPFLDFFYRADLYDRSRAIDWSGKVLGGPDPENAELSLDGFARNSHYKWKENKNHDTTDADGAIHIDDETLDKDADIYELPAQAPLTSTDDMAVLDFYEVEKDEDAGTETVELQDCEPYICAFGPDPMSFIPEDVRDNYTQYALLYFPDALKWDNILAGPYWKDWVKTLQNPVQIEVNLRLGVTDLASLDFSRPIYLDSFGQYFAIVSIRYDSSKGASKATLLKL